MKTVNIQEAKTHLSRLVEKAASGENVVIAKAGKPVAVLSAWQPETATRIGGGWSGRVWIADDFNAPSPVIEEMFGEMDDDSALRVAEKPTRLK